MKTNLILALAAVAACGTASAQLTSDQVPHQRTLPLSQELDQQLQQSRFRLGIFRIQPAFAIRDLGYDNNVYATADDPVADWRSTVAGGVRAIAPIGPKVFLRAEALPEYSYYRKLVNRRAFGGTYGASLLGLFNRMSVEAGGSVARGIAPVNSENERAVLGTLRDGHADAEVFVLRRLSLFGDARNQQQRYDDTSDDVARGLSLENLQRNENLVRGGIRYRFSSYLDFSTAVERTTTAFLTAKPRDNESSAVVFGVRYDRPRSFLNVAIGERTGKGRGIGTTFPEYSTTTGSYYAAHELPSRVVVDLHGDRGVGYSRTVENAYFIETRNGVGLTAPVGQRFAIRAFGDYGTNAYPIPVQSIKRNDKLTTYGGGVGIRLYRNVVFSTLASSNRVDSNLPGNSRTLLRVTTALTFGGGLFQ